MIEVEDLTKYYGTFPAIMDLNFTVEKGEIVGFLGPNGAGKSTTIKILTCYMPPTRGTARIDGLDCFEESIKVRQRIGYLPENVPLYKEMTVRRFLEFVAQVKNINGKAAKSEIGRVLEICGIEDVANRIIGNLSKGYRQRVGLAQALIGNPPVLILDEPTIGLDPAQIVEVRSLIKSLGGEHTILMSSHILPEVAQTCNRVVIINKGRIVAIDSPENLSRQLRKTLQLLISLEPPVDAEKFKSILRNIPSVLDVYPHKNSDHSFIVEIKSNGSVRPDIAKAVVENGFRLVEFRSIDVTLEEIFMQLVTAEENNLLEEH